MRLPLTLGSLVLLGCTASTTQTPSYDAEQVAVAYTTCMPTWFDLQGGRSFIAFHRVNGSVISAIASQPWVYGLTPEGLDCVMDAGSDCDAVRACFGLSVDASGATCPTNPTSTCPSTSRATGCEPSSSRPSAAYDWSIDCAVGGNECRASGLVPGQVRCEFPCASTSASCDGTTRVETCNGVTMRRACPPGTACVVGAFGGVECVGSGPDCTADTCDGDVLVRCDTQVNRQQGSISCSALGQRCTTTSAGAASCGPTSTGCDPTTRLPDCDGSALRYCGGEGEVHRYDCVAHGFGPCEPCALGAPCGALCGPTGVRID